MINLYQNYHSCWNYLLSASVRTRQKSNNERFKAVGGWRTQMADEGRGWRMKDADGGWRTRLADEGRGWQMKDADGGWRTHMADEGRVYHTFEHFYKIQIQIFIVNKGLRPIIQHENKKYNKILHRHVTFISLINNIPLSIINNFQ